MKKIICLIYALAGMVLCSYSQVPAQGGYSLSFDGSDDYVSIPNSTDFNLTEVTIEMWYKWDNTIGTDVNFLIAKGAEQLEIHTGGGGGNFGLRFIPVTGVYLDTGDDVFVNGEWTHVVFVYSPSSSYYKCYINGSEISLTSNGVNPVSTPLTTTAFPLLIGKRGDNSGTFDGQIDEVRIWNTIRTEAQIKTNMYKELTGSESGLVAYYKMSDATGTSLTDNSANANTGTLVNGPEWKISGCLGGSKQALDFDGSNDYVQIPSNSSLNNNNFSVEFWLKLDDTPSSWDGIIDKGRYSAGNEWYFLTIQGTLGCMFGVQGVNEVWFWLNDNNWHHISGTYDGTTMSAYVDGALMGTASGGSYTATSNAIRIGQTLAGFNTANITIDEVRIWNIARTQTQIHDNMMRTLAGNEAGLVAYYRMDQYDGTTLYDMTSNGNNGNLTNMNATTCWIASSAFNTWTGTENSSWTNAGNWTNGVPSTNQSLGFYNTTNGINFNLSSALTYNSIYLSSVNSISLNAGSALTINGTLINQGSFNIDSDNSGDGSLIVKRSATGTGDYNVERYLTAGQWHLVTSSITSGVAGVFHGIWLRPYEESTNTFGDYIVPDNTPMPTGQGFSVWAPDAQTRTFTGSINTGSVGPVSAQLTGSAGANTGWNLMGNPYTSAIDWDASSGWTKTNLANSVYVWNGSQYATYIAGVGANGGSRYIPKGQGFFVQATSTGASLAMNENVQVHNSSAFMKSDTDPENTIRINISSEGYEDEAVIVVRESNNNAFDPMTDAYKFPGSSEAPQIFTKKIDNSELCISSLNSVYDISGLTVYTLPSHNGQHLLTWSHNSQQNMPVLFDNMASSYILPGAGYVYTASENDPADRFTFVDMPSGIEEITGTINCWVYDNILHIENNTGNPIGDVLIYKIDGQIIMHINSEETDLSSLSPAIYIVKIISGTNSIVDKILIEQ